MIPAAPRGSSRQREAVSVGTLAKFGFGDGTQKHLIRPIEDSHRTVLLHEVDQPHAKLAHPVGWTRIQGCDNALCCECCRVDVLVHQILGSMELCGCCWAGHPPRQGAARHLNLVVTLEVCCSARQRIRDLSGAATSCWALPGRTVHAQALSVNCRRVMWNSSCRRVLRPNGSCSPSDHAKFAATWMITCSDVSGLIWLPSASPGRICIRPS